MSLINIAQSGLSSAQNALNIVGNNINNAFNGDPNDRFVQGYSRRNIVMGEAGGRSTSYGFFGYGVQTNDVQRAYDAFISNQVRGAVSQYNGLKAQYEQISQMDNMFGESTQNISVTLGNIFKALEKMSSDPASVAARQEAFSQFKTISNQFRSNSSRINGLEKSTNNQISKSVDEINSYTDQLAKINQELSKRQGQSGSIPGDLLDQRDALLTKLSGLTGVTVSENTTNGTVTVSMTNGMPLVNGNNNYKLQVSTASDNPNKNIVNYIDASGNKVPLDESEINKGKLGGLFRFRNENLVDARNQLNQLALQMANKFNEVNGKGYDRKGEKGGDIFSFDNPNAVANRNNTGDASFGVSYSNTSQVKATDYTITYNGSDWDITRADGSKVTPTVAADGTLQFDGISIKPSGTPEAGDSFVLNPASGVADTIQVALTDGDQIAASSSADPSEESNNENLKELLAIKNQQLIGKSTLSEAYASLASSVGSSTSALKGEITTAGSVANEYREQQQAVSGVNINDEMVKLQMYTQYYQANTQILQTANTIFDAILNLR